MRKRIIILIHITILYIGTCIVYAQSQYMVGGAAYDDAKAMLKTSDGYVIVGSTTSYGIGNYDMYIIKLDNSFAVQWTGTVGGTGADRSYSITQTNDGGYIFAGYTSFPPSGDGDFYIAKYNNTGTFLWSRTLAGNVIHSVRSVTKTSDGGCIATGTTTYLSPDGDCYIVKLDVGGNLQWNKIVWGTSRDFARSIIQTIDGGYIIAGLTSSFGVQGEDVYIVKTDGNGNLTWSATVGGVNNQEANSIIQTSDSGYAIAGSTESAIGNKDMYVIKLDKTGSFQWTKNIGGGNNDIAYSILQNSDGSYVLAGETSSFGVDGPDMYIVKIDGNGVFQWSKAAGGTGSDVANCIVKIPGGYEVAGFTNSFSSGLGNIYSVKVLDNGNMCGNYSSPTSLTGSGAIFTSASSNITTPTWILTTPPSSVGTAGGNVTTLCVISSIQPSSNEIPKGYELFDNYPNPFNPTTIINYAIPEPTKVKLTIYDVNGRYLKTLLSEFKKAGYHQIDFDGSNYASGVYFYRIEAGNFVQSKKMVLVK